MIRWLIERLRRLRPPEPSTTSAYRDVQEAADATAGHIEMIAAAPIGTLDDTVSKLRPIGDLLLDQLSDERLPVAVRSATRNGSTVRIEWTGLDIGLVVSMQSIGITLRDETRIALPSAPVARISNTLTLGLMMLSAPTDRRADHRIAIDFARRVHPAVRRIVANLLDDRRRAHADQILGGVHVALQAVATAIENERPGMLARLAASTRARTFVATLTQPGNRTDWLDPIVLELQVPEHLRAMLPGHSVDQASTRETGSGLVTVIEDDAIGIFEADPDPVRMILSTRLHGTEVSYAAAIDAAIAEHRPRFGDDPP